MIESISNQRFIGFHVIVLLYLALRKWREDKKLLVSQVSFYPIRESRDPSVDSGKTTSTPLVAKWHDAHLKQFQISGLRTLLSKYRAGQKSGP